MLKKRTLALLLSLAMLLTFMPAMAFAEEAADEASDQPEAVETVEEAIAEEPEAEKPEATEELIAEDAAEEAAETNEEAVSEEEITAIEAQNASSAKIVKAVMHTVEPLWGYAGDDDIENFSIKGNYFEVTDSNNTTTKYEFIGDSESDLWGFYDKDKVELNIWPEIQNIKLKEGKNTVKLMTGDENNNIWEIGTIEVTGKNTEKYIKAEYHQANTIQAEYKNGWVHYDPDGNLANFAGDKVTVECYEFVDHGEYNEDLNDWVYKEVKEGPFTYEYECQKNDWGGYSFIRKYKNDNGDEEEDYLNVKFWDDQYWNDEKQSGNWLPGETHKLTASVEGFDITGDIVVKVKEAAAHKHTLKKFKKVKATCQHTGVKEHWECTTCGEMFKDKAGKKKTTIDALTIKKTAHKYKNKKVATEEYLKTPATCTKKGVYYYCSECKVCHEKTKAKKTYTGGSLKPHEFTKIEKVEATCQHTGMKEHYKCSLCNKLYASQKAKKATTAKKLTIKKLKHKFNAKVVEDKYKAKKAGMYYYSCSMCGAKGKKTFKAEVPAE